MRLHFGGSLLPSNSAEILKAIPCSFGQLQVQIKGENETHALVLTQGDKETIIASHPNGFSCHALAKRMVNETPERIKEQLEYIVRCGGSSLSIEAVIALINR